MNNVSSRLLYIFLLLLTTLQMHAQICPNAELQRQMQIEERSFLASMKPGLQHKQMLAVRAAIQGDDAALQQIRRSRNQAPVLPQGVNTSYLQSNLCLFTPTVPSDRPRPLLLYLHGGGWCFGSINSCSRFCAALALEANCCVAALDYSLAGRRKNEARILGKVILDTWRFILGYIAKYRWILFRGSFPLCLFLISLDTFPLHKLNQWTVL